MAGIGFVIVATSPQFPSADDGADDRATVAAQFTGIFSTVEGRTTQGGSSFTPISVDGPQDWPLSVPYPDPPLFNEADRLAALLPAAEMTALLRVRLLSWRRLAHFRGRR